jgi:hypothetical protein
MDFFTIDIDLVKVKPIKIKEEVSPFRLFNGAPKVINLKPKEEKSIKKKIKYSISSKEEDELRKKLKTVQVTAQEIRDQADWWVTNPKWKNRILHVSESKKVKRRRH